MYKLVQFTREQIYKKVWEQPVLLIAKEIGVNRPVFCRHSAAGFNVPLFKLHR